MKQFRVAQPGNGEFVELVLNIFKRFFVYFINFGSFGFALKIFTFLISVLLLDDNVKNIIIHIGRVISKNANRSIKIFSYFSIYRTRHF